MAQRMYSEEEVVKVVELEVKKALAKERKEKAQSDRVNSLNRELELFEARNYQNDKEMPLWIMVNRVIYQGNNTVVFWEDGTKTIVKLAEGDKYSKELGLCYCYLKKIAGNSSKGLKELLAPENAVIVTKKKKKKKSQPKPKDTGLSEKKPVATASKKMSKTTSGGQRLTTKVASLP